MGPRSPRARKSAIANVCIRNSLLSHNLTAGRQTVKEQVSRRRKILPTLASGRFRSTATGRTIVCIGSGPRRLHTMHTMAAREAENDFAAEQLDTPHS